MMPEVDGITVFKFLSEHYPIPTIIFTSKSPETLDDSIQALLLGAFDFIVKPKGLWEEEFPKLFHDNGIYIRSWAKLTDLLLLPKRTR